MTELWNPFEPAFWAQYGHDVWVNVVASLPFFALDVIIITLVLPLAIERLAELRSRKLRLFAMQALAERLAKFSVGASNQIYLARKAEKSFAEVRSDVNEFVNKNKADALSLSAIYLPSLNPEMTRIMTEVVMLSVKMLDWHYRVLDDDNYTRDEQDMENATQKAELMFTRLGGRYGIFGNPFPSIRESSFNYTENLKSAWLEVRKARGVDSLM